MNSYVIHPKAVKSIDWGKYPQACLGVSLGNENERGDKLKAVTTWMNKVFDRHIIDLSDTLYRWNDVKPDGSIPDDAHQCAYRKGSEWLAQAAPALDLLPVGTRVIRWDHWLKHPEFPDLQARFARLMTADERFRAAVDSDVSHFLDRRRRTGDPTDASAVAGCHGFILEELAAHTILFRENPATLRVYPGGSLKVVDGLFRDEFPEAPRGLQGMPYALLRVERAANPLAANLPRPGQASAPQRKLG